MIMRNFRQRLVIVAVLVALGLFAATVWPTLYRYDHIGGGGESHPVRFNRITGAGEIWLPLRGGWTTIRG